MKKLVVHKFELFFNQEKIILNRILVVRSQQWNTKTMCEVFSILTINTPERRSGVFIVSDVILVSLLLTLNRFYKIALIFPLLPLNK